MSPSIRSLRNVKDGLFASNTGIMWAPRIRYFTITKSNNFCSSGPSILSYTDDDMSTSESRRDKFRDIIGYTTTPEGSTYETFNAEVLHKDYKGSFDRDTVFRGEKLHLTFAAVTLGPKAVTALKKTGKPTPASGKTMSHLWNLDHSTVGSVAAIGILTRWVASADLHLTAKGAQTGINWQADLEDYIEYLQTGLDQRKASVLRIFREWDEIFFPDSETSLAGDGASDEDHEKEKQCVMDLLREDEEE
ncbi:hypothetical protein DFH06DRAFT_1409273 [Mycena polygramma]|nr:hypothetical protein DFH06DRAFT_1409273 [Mycena polygramma]